MVAESRAPVVEEARQRRLETSHAAAGAQSPGVLGRSESSRGGRALTRPTLAVKDASHRFAARF
ncbi:hypothetical protein, partial [Nocardioides sp.]|uniref:hypothetical protein n=1 Tax=Nocardioides sp. TaxID=35761 RepID=UPI0025D36162